MDSYSGYEKQIWPWLLYLGEASLLIARTTNSCWTWADSSGGREDSVSDNTLWPIIDTVPYYALQYPRVWHPSGTILGWYILDIKPFVLDGVAHQQEKAEVQATSRPTGSSYSRWTVGIAFWRANGIVPVYTESWFHLTRHCEPHTEHYSCGMLGLWVLQRNSTSKIKREQ